MAGRCKKLFADIHIPRRRRTPVIRVATAISLPPTATATTNLSDGFLHKYAVLRKRRTPSRYHEKAPAPESDSSPNSGRDLDPTSGVKVDGWPPFCESIPLSGYEIPGETVDLLEGGLFPVDDLAEFLRLDGLDGEDPTLRGLDLEVSRAELRDDATWSADSRLRGAQRPTNGKRARQCV